MSISENISTFTGDPKSLSPLALAFIGDGYFEMLVRAQLMTTDTIPIKTLHKMTIEMVSATAQAKSHDVILPFLTQEEADILRRGRGAKVHRIPKNSSVADYHKATALEALFGYLFLKKNFIRLNELFEIILQNGAEHHCR